MSFLYLSRMKNYFYALIYAVGMILTAWVLGHYWKSSKQVKEYIEVTGKASKDFESDLIVWKTSYSHFAPTLKEAFALLREDANRVKAFLANQGISDKEAVFNAVDIEREYETQVSYQNGTRMEQQIFKGFRLRQNMSVESKEVNKVENASRQISDLLEAGLELSSEQPSYFYTRLADLKIQMLADATKDARVRAEQIARNAGSDIGRLKSADMGIFQITAPNSTEEYSWGGTFNTSSRRKTASITVKLLFSVN